MSGKRGEIQRGNKVVIRNYISLKIIDLKVNLLEPTTPIKNNEQLSVYQIVTRVLRSWRFYRMILHTNHILIV
jgi:hypothetical protein